MLLERGGKGAPGGEGRPGDERAGAAADWSGTPAEEWWRKEEGKGRERCPERQPPDRKLAESMSERLFRNRCQRGGRGGRGVLPRWTAGAGGAARWGRVLNGRRPSDADATAESSGR